MDAILNNQLNQNKPKESIYSCHPFINKVCTPKRSSNDVIYEINTSHRHHNNNDKNDNNNNSNNNNYHTIVIKLPITFAMTTIEKILTKM